MPDRSESYSKTGEVRRIELSEPEQPPAQEALRPVFAPPKEPEPHHRTGLLPIVPEVPEDQVDREDNLPGEHTAS